MILEEFIRRTPRPGPWQEGDKIPWSDPAFSRRMLAEHLSQEHDKASRRQTVVDGQVDWIHRTLLPASGARILDLGCGPGLYTCGLARRGHSCVGIDFGPASVEYARSVAEAEGLACEHIQADLREADFGAGFHLAMFLFGELHTFRPDEARAILGRVFASLEEGGALLLEPHHRDAQVARGNRLPIWMGLERGLFSDDPHLHLVESFWHEEAGVATERHSIIDAATAQVETHTTHEQAYTDEALDERLTAAGFRHIERFASLTGVDAEAQPGLFGLVARRS